MWLLQVKLLAEKAEIEREQWQKDLLSKYAAEAKQKEVEMGARLQAERDAEIEMVITKLEEVSASERTRMQQDMTSKAAMKDEMHVAQLREAKDAERQVTPFGSHSYTPQYPTPSPSKSPLSQWMEKYMEVCKSSSTIEERTKVLKARVLELEVDLSSKSQECVKLENQASTSMWATRDAAATFFVEMLAYSGYSENAHEPTVGFSEPWVGSNPFDGVGVQVGMRMLDLDKVREQAEAEAMARIAHMAAEKRRAEAAHRDMQEKLETAEREHATQVKALKDEKHRELDTINSRVRTAIAKKDEALAAVTVELNSARTRCKQYEEMLEKQRQEFLGASWGNNPV